MKIGIDDERLQMEIVHDARVQGSYLLKSEPGGEVVGRLVVVLSLRLRSCFAKRGRQGWEQLSPGSILNFEQVWFGTYFLKPRNRFGMKQLESFGV